MPENSGPRLWFWNKKHARGPKDFMSRVWIEDQNPARGTENSGHFLGQNPQFDYICMIRVKMSKLMASIDMQASS